MAELIPDLGPPLSRKGPVPWNLDALPPALLRKVYAQMDEFVARLRARGMAVPGCWYLAGHGVHQLAAVMYWYEKAHRLRLVYPMASDPKRLRIDPQANARDTAEWYFSPWGLAGMVKLWSDLPCGGKPSGHNVDQVPDLAAAVEAHVEVNRSFTGRPR
jgi:hypothetical protein